MSYKQTVSRANPQLISMILDDSSSMQAKMPKSSDTRYQWVQRYAYSILQELMARSTEADGDQIEIRPRYYVDLITYGSTSTPFHSEELSIDNFLSKYKSEGNSLNLGGKKGGTDAQKAFTLALDRIGKALKKEEFQGSFPPMVFHLTDGESATDAQPVADQIKKLTTSDGEVLIVNAYIGTKTNLKYNDPNDFPGYIDTKDVGSSPDNLRLFNMSSIIPATIHANLVEDGIFPNIRGNARLFFDVRTKEMLKHVLQVVGSGGSRPAGDRTLE